MRLVQKSACCEYISSLPEEGQQDDREQAYLSSKEYLRHLLIMSIVRSIQLEMFGHSPGRPCRELFADCCGARW